MTHLIKGLVKAAQAAAPIVGTAALTVAAIVIAKNEKERTEWIEENKKKLGL